MRDFMTKAVQVAELVTEKNKAYGNSSESSVEFFKLLYPNGVPVEQYQNVLLFARMFDKLKRIANNQEGFQGEDAKQDLLGYALLLATGVK